MSAGIYNIALEKGSYYSDLIELFEPDVPPVIPGDPATPGPERDMTGRELRGSVKAKSKDVTELCSISFQWLDQAKGKFYLIFTPTESIKLPTTGKSYADLSTFYYDVESYEPGVPDSALRELQGTLTLSPEQTTKET